MEILCILNIFAIKYLLTKEERNKIAVSDLKEISTSPFHISSYPLFVTHPSDALRVRPSTKYVLEFLVQKVLGETETAIMRLSER